VAVAAAFSVTSFADGPSDPSRYVIPAFLALAAVVPVFTARADRRRSPAGGDRLLAGGRRITVAVGVTMFGVLGFFNVGQSLQYVEAGFVQTAHQGPAVVDFLERQGVTTGYTGYFDSHPLTLESDMHVHFYPVVACRAPVSPRLCPLYVNARTNWYVPRPATRTFLLFDARTPPSVGSPPTPDLGSPALVRRFGALVVYLYDYDVATRFAPACPTGTLTCPDAPTTATFTYPVNGELGVVTPARFTWSRIAGAQHYFFTLGTTTNGKDLVNSGILPPTAGWFPVPKLPGGRLLYASLLTEFNGTWTSQALVVTVR
jgi:hypothetical protein